MSNKKGFDKNLLMKKRKKYRVNKKVTAMYSVASLFTLFLVIISVNFLNKKIYKASGVPFYANEFIKGEKGGWVNANFEYGKFPKTEILNSGDTQTLFNELDGLSTTDGEVITYQNKEYVREDKNSVKHFFLIEPITWRILKIEDDKILAMTENVIETRVWDRNQTVKFSWDGSEWGTSNNGNGTGSGNSPIIRLYLNSYKSDYDYSSEATTSNGYTKGYVYTPVNEQAYPERFNTFYKKGFLEKAFTEDERNNIIPDKSEERINTKKKSGNFYLGVVDGGETEDKVRLLTTSEHNTSGLGAKYGFYNINNVENANYFSNTKLNFTDYANLKGTSLTREWLRTAYHYSDVIYPYYYASNSNNVGTNNDLKPNNYSGIRPVISINREYLESINKKITLTASEPRTYYSFEGWYENENKISVDNILTDISFENIKNYKAKFKFEKNSATIKGTEYTPYHTTNDSGVNKGYIYLGTFPKDLVTDDDLINTLNKISKRSDNTVIYDGNKYLYEDLKWYKFDQIKWRILSIEDNNLRLLAENVLETRIANTYNTYGDYIDYDGTYNTSSKGSNGYPTIKLYLNSYDTNGVAGYEYNGTQQLATSSRTYTKAANQSKPANFTTYYQIGFLEKAFSEGIQNVIVPDFSEGIASRYDLTKTEDVTKYNRTKDKVRLLFTTDAKTDNGGINVKYGFSLDENGTCDNVLASPTDYGKAKLTSTSGIYDSNKNIEAYWLYYCNMYYNDYVDLNGKTHDSNGSYAYYYMGVRPTMTIDASQLTKVAGNGSFETPYSFERQLQIKSDEIGFKDEDLLYVLPNENINVLFTPIDGNTYTWYVGNTKLTPVPEDPTNFSYTMKNANLVLTVKTNVTDDGIKNVCNGTNKDLILELLNNEKYLDQIDKSGNLKTLLNSASDNVKDFIATIITNETYTNVEDIKNDMLAILNPELSVEDDTDGFLLTIGNYLTNDNITYDIYETEELEDSGSYELKSYDWQFDDVNHTYSIPSSEEGKIVVLQMNYNTDNAYVASIIIEAISEITSDVVLKYANGGTSKLNKMFTTEEFLTGLNEIDSNTVKIGTQIKNASSDVIEKLISNINARSNQSKYTNIEDLFLDIRIILNSISATAIFNNSNHSYTINVSEYDSNLIYKMYRKEGLNYIEEGSTFTSNENIFTPSQTNLYCVGVNFPNQSNIYYSNELSLDSYIEIKFEDNGEEVCTSKNIVSGSSLGILPTPPNKDGYTFKGWYIGENNGPYTEYGQISTNTTFNANYEINHYTITLNTDGGELSSGTTTLERNHFETYNLPNASKTGFEFLGWYDGNSKVENTDIVTSSKTLKAKYEVFKYNVNLDANGGNVDTALVRYEYLSNYTNLPIPTREDFLFGGWYEESDGYTEYHETAKITSSSKVTEDTKLYARWLKVADIDDVVYCNAKYDSSKLDNKLAITDDKNTLILHDEVNITYGDNSHDNKKVGKGIVKISDKTNTSLFITKEFNIIKKEITSNDITLKESDKEIVIYKDGINQVVSNVTVHPIARLESCGNEEVTLTYKNAYISKTNGDPLYITNKKSTSGEYDNIYVSDIQLDNSNYYLNAGVESKIFTGYGKLVDITSPTITKIEVKRGPIFARGGDIEVLATLSEGIEGLDLNMALYSGAYKANLKLDNGVELSCELLQIENTTISQDSVVTELWFKGQIPDRTKLDDNKIYKFSDITFSHVDTKDVIKDNAGNDLSLVLSNAAKTTYTNNVKTQSIDTNGYPINIICTNGQVSNDQNITFNININGDLKDSYTKSTILDKFILKDSDNNSWNLNNLPNGVSVTENVPFSSYIVSVDTYKINKISKTDKDGKLLTLSIDKGLLEDKSNNINIASEESVLVKRTLNENKIQFVYNKGQANEKLLTNNSVNKYLTSIDSPTKEFKFYVGDTLTLIAKTDHTYISFNDKDGTEFDSKNNLINKDEYKITLTNDLVQKFTNLYSYKDEFASMMSDTIILKLRTKEDITNDINAYINSKDKEGIISIITNEDELRVINDNGTVQQKTIDIIDDYKEQIAEELIRKNSEEKVNITVNNLKDILNEIIIDLDKKDDFEFNLPSFIANNIENAMKEYEKLSNWIKDLIKDTADVLNMFKTYYGDETTPGLIDGYEIIKELSENESVEIFGAIYSLEKNTTDEKVFINVKKITDKADLDKIKNDLKSNKDTIEYDEKENIFASYDIKLVDAAGNEFAVKDGETILVKISLPKEKFDEVKKCYHLHYKDNTIGNDIEIVEKIGDLKKTLFKNEFNVYFEVDSFSTFTLTTDKQEEKPKPTPSPTPDNQGTKTAGNTITIQIVQYPPYINGYPDGTFKPNEGITRAELCKIVCGFSDSFNENKLNEYKKYAKNYKDVENNAWYSGYVGYVTNEKLMNGYNDGTFKPNEKLTRAEACKVISELFVNKSKGITIQFADVKYKNWFSEYVNKLVDAGLIDGYPDGTFKPNNKIKRSEIVSLFNKASNRPSGGSSSNKFTDINSNNWYFNDVIMASSTVK